MVSNSKTYQTKIFIFDLKDTSKVEQSRVERRVERLCEERETHSHPIPSKGDGK